MPLLREQRMGPSRVKSQFSGHAVTVVPRVCIYAQRGLVFLLVLHLPWPCTCCNLGLWLPLLYFEAVVLSQMNLFQNMLPYSPLEAFGWMYQSEPQWWVTVSCLIFLKKALSSISSLLSGKKSKLCLRLLSFLVSMIIVKHCDVIGFARL